MTCESLRARPWLRLRADWVEELWAVVADVVDGRGDRTGLQVPVGGLAEHQLERAYRDRFTRAQHAEDEARHLLTHAQDTVSAQQEEPAAYFFALARPGDRSAGPAGGRAARGERSEPPWTSRESCNSLAGAPVVVLSRLMLDVVASPDA